MLGVAMQKESPDLGIMVTTLAVVLVLLGAISLIFWGMRRLWRSFSNVPEPYQTAAIGKARPAWLWLVLIIGFGLIFWSFRPRSAKVGGLPPAPEVTPRITLVICGGFFALLVAVVAFQVIRAYDLGVRRAEQRASAGDLDGAIADLREQIEHKGPTQRRVNALGVLLTRCERWDEAAAPFRAGAALHGVQGVCQANLGMALLKGGKPEEALSVLQDAARIRPQAPVLLCLVGLHTAGALAAQGRWDEAEQHFLGATAVARTLPKFQRTLLEQDFEQLRLKFEERPGATKKAQRLDEL